MKSIILAFIITLIPLVVSAEPIYFCTDAAGQVTYTNKELVGQSCVWHVLPGLSVVPKRTLPTSPSHVDDVHQDSFDIQDPPLVEGPRETHTINPVVGHNVAEQVCDLYGKWLDLNLATRGGLYYNKLTAPLLTLFGGGFIPMECKR